MLRPRLLFALLLFLGLFAMTLRPVADPDFWWHLRTGQWMAENGQIPRSDPFSFTLQGHPWVTHEWLTERILFALYRVGGFGLLIFVFSLLITGAYGLVYLHSPGKPYAAGFATLLAALAAAPAWGVRPQMVSLFLTALFLHLLDRFTRQGRWQWLLPLPFLMALWVNLHAGYFLGLVLIAVHLAGEGLAKVPGWVRRERFSLRKEALLAGALALCLAATLLNPHGWHILVYPFETLTSPAMMQFIQEWFSPDFHRLEWMPLAVLLLALIAAPALLRQPVSLTQVLLVVLFGFAALRSMRHAPLFGLTAIPFLATQLAALLEMRKEVEAPPPRFARWLNPLLVGLALLAVGLRFMTVLQEQPTTEAKTYPQAAVDWLLAHRPEGNLYNTYGWGGYLIWRLYPQYRVYIDGRADVYGDAFIYDYLKIYSALPGWQEKLTERQVNIVLVERDSSIAYALQDSPDWQVVYQDESTSLFIRKER